MEQLPIKEYFLIGDLHSAALVSKKASIQWLCWPHFDSQALFASLMGKEAGEFSIIADGYKSKAKYRENTAIVDFYFHGQSEDGEEKEFKLSDFMVPGNGEVKHGHFLIRKFTGLKGDHKIKLHFNPKPNFGKNIVEMRKEGDNKIAFDEDETDNHVTLHVPEGSEISKDLKTITFNLEEGEEKRVLLEYCVERKSCYKNGDDFEKKTEEFWEQWLKKGDFKSVTSGSVETEKLARSAITLKLMQFQPTGALIAAPTTSLPEVMGGERNWDYRFTWIRDGTFILYGLYLLGYKEEAQKFFEYIERCAEECEDQHHAIKLLYTIEGKPVPEEHTLEHLEGYRNSYPVRIGNEAKDQFQLDVYGGLIDAYYFATKHDSIDSEINKSLILTLAEKIEKHWKSKDHGIWEVRDGFSHYTYSKVVSWMGINRLLRMKERLKLNDEQIDHYEKLEKEIYDWTWENCYDEKRKIFRQHTETDAQDATSFLFVLLQFLNRNDPRAKEIVKNAYEELVENDVFIYRYKNNDGMKGQEGAFLLCSFWMISAMSEIGELERAERYLQKLEDYFDKSGLLPEEIDAKTGEYLGNFPQAFSHLGYISCLRYIEKGRRRAK